MLIVWLFIVGLSVLLLLTTVADAGMGAVAAWRWFRPRSRRKSPVEASPLPRILFVVPAHDEELLIGRCLGSLRALAYPPDRFEALVVADNCSDGTAKVALMHGVPCLERLDTERKGKPWALAWALERIDLARFDGVVILDADSRIEADYASALARTGPLRGRVVQGYNDVTNATDSNLTRMAAVFSAARCLRMNGLKSAAGLNVPLGNGYCLGAGVLERFGWRAFSISEDWELYALLTVDGVRILNQPQARVHSQEARSLRQSSSQRKRWAAGKMQVLLTQARPLLSSRRIGPLQKLDALAELLAPGPAVHLGVAALLLAASLASGAPGAALLGGLVLLPIVRLGVYTALAVTDVEQPGRALVAFLALPGYAVWRLGVQASALIMGARAGWTRTARHREA